MTNPRHNKDPSEALFRARTMEQAQERVARGGDINIRNEKGRTPFSNAVRKGHRPIVEYFLTLHPDVSVTDFNGIPLCIDAARAGLCDIFDHLVARGMDPRLTEGKGAGVLLVSAGLPNMLGHLLDRYDADIHACDVEGRGVMHYLLSFNAYGFLHQPCLDALLDAGADINAPDAQGITPLMLVRQAPALKMLLKAGANPNLADAAGRTALYKLLDQRWGVNYEMCELLVQAGASVDTTDALGKSPLDFLQEAQKKGAIISDKCPALIASMQGCSLSRSTPVASSSPRPGRRV